MQFFNQDGSCVTHIRENDEFVIYQCEPFRICSQNEIKDIGQIKMLYRSNILLYLDTSNKILSIWDDKQKKETGFLRFTQTVKNYFITTTYIYVVFLNKIVIYDIKNLQVINTITTLLDNVICDVSNNNNVLVYKHQNTTVQTPNLEFKCFDEGEITNIATHESKLIAVVADGNFIRIFNHLGTLLHEFRRGLHSDVITCMKFNENATMLALSSQNGTIHIFSLTSTNTKSSFHFLTSILQNEYLKSEYAKKKIFLPKGNTQFSFGQNDCLFITNNNQFYKYEADLTLCFTHAIE